MKNIKYSKLKKSGVFNSVINKKYLKMKYFYIFLLIVINSIFLWKTSDAWFYTCNATNNQCNRSLNQLEKVETFPTLEVCQLLCGTFATIWPRPTQQFKAVKELIKFSKEIRFKNQATGLAYNFLQHSITNFNNNLKYDRIASCSEKPINIVVGLKTLTETVYLTWNTSEKYEMTIQMSDSNTLSVSILGDTVFGVRHGLETLLQLIVPYPEKNEVCFAIFKDAKIVDKPIYKHRGLLIDSARNFLSLDTIKRSIDGLAASKMNVLHWHATDTQSFPLELPRLPNMTLFGAYSPKKIYSKDDVIDLIEYARLRGVRLLLEIDGPSHSGSGWEWGPEAGFGNLSVCINQQPWRSYCIQPPCGQLNPANPNLYKVLEEIFKDVNDYFPFEEVFHAGGDEVFIPCWNTTDEILKYIGNKPRTEETFLDLWAEHQQKLIEAFNKSAPSRDTKFIVWTSHLTQSEVVEKYLDKNRYVIQTWVPDTDPLPEDLLLKGYQVIMSTKNKWYLDHGFWGTTTYHNWRDVYSNRISSNPGVLGGEVCMWGEYVDDNNFEPRTWPRTAAAAERLWSNPEGTSKAAEGRFFLHRDRLVERGIKASAVIPQWCVQNEGGCNNYDNKVD